MPNLKLTTLAHGAALLGQAAKRSDLNSDGAVRVGEAAKVGALQKKPKGVKKGNGPLGGALSAEIRFSQQRGGVTIEKVVGTIGETKRRVSSLAINGVVTEAQQKKARTGAERTLISFSLYAAKKTISDFIFPKARTERTRYFDWRGTAAEVAQSLLAATTDAKKDNFWPSWATAQKGQASRYVVGASVAKKMIAQLKNLSAPRVKAVLQEVSRRTRASEFGCVSVDSAARSLLVAYSKTVGLTNAVFLSPSAPGIPPW